MSHGFPPMMHVPREPTAKELAEKAAMAALESLRAALNEETKVRDQLRGLLDNQFEWSSTAVKLTRDLRDAQARSDAAFAAWRKAQEAIGP